MTMSNDTARPSSPTNASTAPGATPASGAKEVATAAAGKAADVAGSAADSAKGVATEASTQTKAVVAQAKDQVRSLADQTKGELMAQADTKTGQAAVGLRTLSEQISALGEGRPDAAGPLPHYLQVAQGKVADLASRIERGGPQGVLDDLTSFARRRPGLFILGAVGAGFVIGRVVRSGAAAASAETETHDPASPAATLPPPAPWATERLQPAL